MFDSLTVELVSHADLNRIEPVEHVEQRQRDLGYAVQPDHPPRSHGIEPSDAARSSGGGAVFATAFADFVPCRIEELCRERSAAHPGAVGLEHADHRVDLVWRDSGTLACAGR